MSNKIIITNQIKKKFMLDFLIKNPKIEIKWKIIYEKLELKDNDLQIPLIISKYIKSKVKIIKYFFKIFTKKYNLPYEIILKFYLYICKKKFNKNSNLLLFFRNSDFNKFGFFNICFLIKYFLLNKLFSSSSFIS